MAQSKQKFFIALLPPQEIQQFANEIKFKFAEVYNSYAAQKSPPHITLQPPFDWFLEDLPTLGQYLQQFAQTESPIPVILSRFGAFRPRVIYINVLKTPKLLDVQQKLIHSLELDLNIVHQASKNRLFSPHLTVGFRDLTKENFYKAWSEFEHIQVEFKFRVPQLTLLIHNGRGWEISQEFSFNVS